MECSLTPAYNNHYSSSQEVLKAWNSDKDFVLNDPESRFHGMLANKTQLLDAGYTQFIVRYGPSNREQHSIKVVQGRDQAQNIRGETQGGEGATGDDPEAAS
jgi:hypothetical protein